MGRFLEELKERLLSFIGGLFGVFFGGWVMKVSDNPYIDAFGLILFLAGIGGVLWALGLERSV